MSNSNHKKGLHNENPNGNTSSALKCPINIASDYLNVNRLNAGGSASSAPGLGEPGSSPNMEAMREWW